MVLLNLGESVTVRSLFTSRKEGVRLAPFSRIKGQLAILFSLGRRRRTVPFPLIIVRLGGATLKEGGKVGFP